MGNNDKKFKTSSTFSVVPYSTIFGAKMLIYKKNIQKRYIKYLWLIPHKSNSKGSMSINCIKMKLHFLLFKKKNNKISALKQFNYLTISTSLKYKFQCQVNNALLFDDYKLWKQTIVCKIVYFNYTQANFSYRCLVQRQTTCVVLCAD